MRRLAIALVCGLLVTTAGCAGLLDSGGQPAATEAPTTDTATATSSGTPTTQAAEQFAPGLTTEGVTDALALADAHREYVRTHAFVKHSSVERTNGSETGTAQTTLAYANQSHWLLNQSVDGVRSVLGTNGTFAMYADGERVAVRQRVDDNVTYGVRTIEADGEAVPVPPEEVFPVEMYERGLVYSLFANADVTVHGPEGSTVRVDGTAGELTLGDATVTDVEFTATVTDRGLVESLDATYEQGGATVERSVTFDVTVTRPVEQPDWYDRAVNGTAA